METRFNSGKEEKDKDKSRLDDRLLKTRTLLIYGGIDQKLAKEVTQKLLVLSAESDEDIKIIIIHLDSSNGIEIRFPICRALCQKSPVTF